MCFVRLQEYDKVSATRNGADITLKALTETSKLE